MGWNNSQDAQPEICIYSHVWASSKMKAQYTLPAIQVGVPFFPHCLKYAPPCLDTKDDLCGKGPLLNQWLLGIFPLEPLNKLLRSWTFGIEALPSFSSALTSSTYEVLRRLTAVTLINWLSQKPPVPLPFPNHMPRPPSISTPCTSYAPFITTLYCPLQNYPDISSSNNCNMCNLSAIFMLELFICIKL